MDAPPEWVSHLEKILTKVVVIIAEWVNRFMQSF